MVLFSLKRPDQPAPLKKKFILLNVFGWWLSRNWRVPKRPLSNTYVTITCVRVWNTSRDSHSKTQHEIPPGIPIPKNNVKYLHSKKIFHIVPKRPLKRRPCLQVILNSMDWWLKHGWSKKHKLHTTRRNTLRNRWIPPGIPIQKSNLKCLQEFPFPKATWNTSIPKCSISYRNGP